MRIGYACLTVGVPNTRLRSCQRKNAGWDVLKGVIAHNLAALDRIIDYNIGAGIRLFRISSDIIPFGSSPINSLPWPELFAPDLAAIGSKIRQAGLRVSMHPGQYTVLNSHNPEIVERAVADLEYHARFLECLGVGADHKIVLHIGGVYGDRKGSIDRFIRNYTLLNSGIRQRLVIENDDRSYSPGEVLAIAREAGIPAIYDNLHRLINPGPGGSGQNAGRSRPARIDALGNSDHSADYDWIDQFAATWKRIDGPPKIHYSQQDPGKQPGAHSNTIRIAEFYRFYSGLAPRDLDIMMEVKDKNLSAVKCLNTTAMTGHIEVLEQEWSRYKYRVLEGSPARYQQIRELLKDKRAYPAVSFYELVESALADEIEPGHAVNAAQHVWGYFPAVASENEKVAFEAKLDAYRREPNQLTVLKRFLWKLAEKYRQEYLLNSYYFVL